MEGPGRAGFGPKGHMMRPTLKQKLPLYLHHHQYYQEALVPSEVFYTLIMMGNLVQHKDLNRSPMELNLIPVEALTNG
ncbi:hypothetical protein RchiOBHm_Chr5g0052081 [Rosa chinensis]|uniref:Uncharacterized protein n=1 Tax=Rosa chinensis TaxID=74649 RepID=A0A2P6QFL3_ROSCH|nr:hypothetical protein RchiOBHm_Chr5g0052081 [Rosa chinensis]